MMKHIMLRFSILILLTVLLYGCGSSKDAQEKDVRLRERKPKESATSTENKEESSAEPYTAEWYISNYKGFAIEEMKRNGIPASITLAQGMLESSYGKSKLSKKGKNHFGIKCHRGHWGGGEMYLEDDAPNECFRTYETVFQSYKDHSHFLKSSSRYDFLFDYKPTAYEKWAEGLQKAGYATNPNYSDILIRLVERYDLDYFDKFHDEPFEAESEKQQVVEKDHEQGEEEGLKPGVFKENGLKATKASKGETFNDIADQYDIRKQKILDYNDLARDDQLKPGMLLYLEPKRNKTDISYHVVDEGQTMHSISQRYGIKLKKLFKRNRLKKGEQPAVNERLFLRERRYRKPKIQEEKVAQHEQSSTEKTEKSPKEEKPAIHTVKEGETMEAIAEKYDMALKTLYKRNRMDKNDQPAEGAAIHLKTRRYVKPDLRKEPVKANSPKLEDKKGSDSPHQDKKSKEQKEKESSGQKRVDKPKDPNQSKVTEKQENKSIPSSKPKKKAEKNRTKENPNADPKSHDQSHEKRTEDVDTHVVKPGESLYGIAQQYQVSRTQIKEWNNLEGAQIDVGQELQVRELEKEQQKTREAAEVKDATSKPNPQFHKVKPGESLYGIAQEYQVSRTQIKEWNNLDGAQIEVGQRLQVRKVEKQQQKSGEAAEVKDATSKPNPQFHKVKPGESLYGIAQQYQVSRTQIKEWNNLDGAQIDVGQKLQVRELEKEQQKAVNANQDKGASSKAVPEVHKVKSGETLYSISNEYQIPISKIQSLNNLNGKGLKVGMELKLQASKSKKDSKEEKADKDFVVHQVEQGETLYNIANRYELPVNAIKESNNLESETLKIGQELKIPQK